MKKRLLPLFGLFVSPFLFSQILTVNSGSSFSIASGSSLTLDGLEIAPADAYVISGDNAVSRSATAVTSGSSTSVSRVYSSSALLSGFTGTLTFSYLEGELNDIAEENLVLELQAEDDSWVSFQGSVDQANNTVSYTFNDAVSFKAVTASAVGATLTIEDIEQTASQIVVYPNPTADRVFIQSEGSIRAELFDLMGRKVKATNQKKMDVSELPIGNYILNIKNQNNKIISLKIIKQ